MNESFMRKVYEEGSESVESTMQTTFCDTPPRL